MGQYSYVGDDGKTYTVRYSAGRDGFRILSGDHIPSGGQNVPSAAVASVVGPNNAVVEEEYDYQYYDDTPQQSVFVNPHDPSHYQASILPCTLKTIVSTCAHCCVVCLDSLDSVFVDIV